MKNSAFGKVTIPKAILFSLTLSCFAFLFFRTPISCVVRTDYRNFATAAQIISKGNGKNLYDLVTQKDVQSKLFDPYFKVDMFLPYLNLPFYALAYIPLVSLHPMLSHKLIVVINILIIAAIVALTSKIFPKAKKLLSWPFFIFLFLPFFYSMLWAQFSPFITLMTLLIYKKLKEKDSHKAGVLAGFLLIKVQFLVILPFLFLLCQNKKDFVLGFLKIFFPIMAINTLIAGPNFFLDYPRLLTRTNHPLFQNRSWQKYTLVANLDALGIIGNQHPLLQHLVNLSLYTFVLYFFQKSIKILPFDRLFASALIFAVVFAVHVFGHDYGIIFVSILILLNTISKASNSVWVSNRFAAILLYFLPFLTLLGNTSVASLLLMLIGFSILVNPVSTSGQIKSSSFEVTRRK